MTKIFFLMAACLTFLSGLAQSGQKVVVVQSARIGPYETALRGFRSVCKAEISRLVISELERPEVVRKVNEMEPAIVLAMGRDALTTVKEIKVIPIVYLMVLNPWSVVQRQGNVTGVSMNIAQKEQLVTLLKMLPDVKSVGVLYDQERTGHLVNRAMRAAEELGITLIPERIGTSGDVPGALKAMEGRIDIFWMLPDITAITPETTELILLFSLENKIPILAFSEKYLELGALISIGLEAFDLGRQAGEMANRILSGTKVRNVEPVDARKAVISINLKVARKLGVTVNGEMIAGVNIIE